MLMNRVRRPSTPIVFSSHGRHADALSRKRPQPCSNLLSLPSRYQPYRSTLTPPAKRLACNVSSSLKRGLTGNLPCRHDLGPSCAVAPGSGACRTHRDSADDINGCQGIGYDSGLGTSRSHRDSSDGINGCQGIGRSGNSGGFTGQADNTPYGDSDVIELHYQELLQSDPQNPLFLQNYAQFLLHVKHDLPKAEEYYERTILACPHDGRVLATYAELLWDAHRDSDRTSMYFEQALQASPEDPYVMASYASFVWQLESQENLADTLTPLCRFNCGNTS